MALITVVSSLKPFENGLLTPTTKFSQWPETNQSFWATRGTNVTTSSVNPNPHRLAIKQEL